MKKVKIKITVSYDDLEFLYKEFGKRRLSEILRDLIKKYKEYKVLRQVLLEISEHIKEVDDLLEKVRSDESMKKDYLNPNVVKEILKKDEDIMHLLKEFRITNDALVLEDAITKASRKYKIPRSTIEIAIDLILAEKEGS